MTERFERAMRDRAVRRDTRVVGGLTAIWCRGHHRDLPRARLVSDAFALGVYGWRVPRLCEECAEHQRYAEKRRAYCPKAPKPFCAHCDTHCYAPEEAEWQRRMMRYSGPRSAYQGYLIAGLRHRAEATRWRKRMERTAAAAAEGERTDP